MKNAFSTKVKSIRLHFHENRALKDSTVLSPIYNYLLDLSIL